MVQAQDFILSKDEAEFICNSLKNRYGKDAISLVHAGMILAPRFIKAEVMPGPKENLMDPNFRMQTIHVATSLRIFGLHKFGQMYFFLIEHLGINNAEAINEIIIAFRIAYKASEKKSLSLWASSLIETTKLSDKVFSKEPVFEKDNHIDDEIDYYDEVMKEIFIDEHYKDKILHKDASGIGNFFTTIHDILNGKNGWKFNLPPFSEENNEQESDDDVS